jgi:glyoxylase-like metal-dependent hydrolase (beta-lactamase superfamily II)
MKLKRVLKWLGALVLVLLVAAGAVWYSAFGNNRPIVAGQLSPGVETVADGFVSVFMLDVAAGKVALVDAGNDKSAKAILMALARRGLGPSAVSAIFLTHGHQDHTAGCSVFPGAQVYALESEVPLVGSAAKIEHPLKDGETVDVGDLHVETFAVPGHTPGSAVYLAHGVLFFGDSAGGSKSGEMMRAVRLFSSDPAQNVASLKSLAARLQPRAAEIKELAFAHSGPLPGFQPLADFAASH